MKKHFVILSSIVMLGTSLISAPLTSSAALGDIDPNGDGTVNMGDYVYIIRYLNGWFEPTDLTALDFDENGLITYVDALKVQFYDAGM